MAGSPPIATPSRVSSARPRVMTAARVLSPTPRPWAMPAGDRDHVLERAAQLAADDVVVGVDAEQPALQERLRARRPPRGPRWRSRWPRPGRAMISRAMFGPVSAAAGWPGSTSLMTSVMRSSESRSRPLVRLTTGIHGRTSGRPPRASSRKPCDGTPTMSSSACATASARSPVACSSAGSASPEVPRVRVPFVDLPGGVDVARPDHGGMARAP